MDDYTVEVVEWRDVMAVDLGLLSQTLDPTGIHLVNL